MRIGEVSKIVGIKPSAIRFYERHGLLHSGKATRTGNGYRFYSSEDVRDISLIRKFKELGLELEEIKSLLCEESKQCSDLVASLEAQIAKYRAIASQINDRIERLESSKQRCESNCRTENSVKTCCN